MRRSASGFTIAEALVSISILTVALFGTIKVATDVKKSSASSELSSGFNYYEDLLVARGTMVASNLLFWMNNVTDGCKGASYFFNHQVPPGRSTADLALVNVDFFTPLNFEEHELTPFTGWDLASSNASIARVKAWYDANASSHSADPEVQVVSECVSNAVRAYPGKDFTDLAEFRFCLLLKSNVTPSARTRAQSGALGLDNSFIIGSFQARLVDLYTSGFVPCKNKDIDLTEQLTVNRSIEIDLKISEVKDYRLPYGKQSRYTITRSYSAPKSQRMLINCNHCLNLGDPAFRYECGATVAAGCNL